MCSQASPLLFSSSLRHPYSALRSTFCALLVVSSLLVASVCFAKPETIVFLNGQKSKVFFNDGDSFTVLDGAYTGMHTRLDGFNTLESFGPAHRWGSWAPSELYVVAKEATLNARRGTWHCTSDLAKDGYGRTLWHCEDLIQDDIRKGLAHAYSVDEKPADANLLALQKQAQTEKVGMWTKGVPPFVLTSLHSADEGAGADTYNRLISTTDGHTEKWKHQDNYKECQWVCHPADSTDAARACMLYVGYQHRYGPAQAECLKH